MPVNAHTLFADRMQHMRPSLVRELLKNAGGPGFISFAGGLPNPKFFQAEALITATEAVLRNDAANVLQYAVSEGYPSLREWIATRYKQRYSLDIPIENIMITSGSQQGLDLLGKVLLNPGDVVINERPGYQGAIHALSIYQPRFAGVPVRQLRVTDLEPARVWMALEDRAWRTWDRAKKYYESLRLVYEIQQTLKEWAEEPAAPAAAVPSRQKPAGASGKAPAAGEAVDWSLPAQIEQPGDGRKKK